MTDKPAERFAELPEETQAFLTDLSKDDIAALKTGLPVIKSILGFGRVAKWMAITMLGLLAGTVLLWESVLKIIGWIRQ